MKEAARGEDRDGDEAIVALRPAISMDDIDISATSNSAKRS
jgi:hypothetical protein